MKCICLCFGFSDLSGKKNLKEIIDCESLSQGLASWHSSVIIIGLLVNTRAKYSVSTWLISQRHRVTLRFLKISLKKEVYWWHHLLFLMMSSTKCFLYSKLCNSHVSRSITSLIVIIWQWVLLVQIY